MAKCRNSVLKKMLNPDLAEEYRRADVHYGPCPYYEEGDSSPLPFDVDLPGGRAC